MTSISINTKHIIRFFGYADSKRREVEKYISKMDTRMEELKIEYPNLNDEHSLIYSPEDVFTKRKLKVARFFKTLKFRIQKITKTTNQKSLIDRYPYVLYHTKPKEIEGKEFIEDVQEINLNITPLNQLANAFQERGVTAKVYEEIKAEKQKQKKKDAEEFTSMMPWFKMITEDVQEPIVAPEDTTTEVNRIQITDLNELANIFQERGITAKIYKEETTKGKQNQIE